MRNLTIERRKAYAGCLAKISFYVEDPAGDLTISGVKCRLLGKLKNGQKQTFLIGDEATRIFAIFSKVERNLSNEMFCIPAGTEDVYLSGQNQLNPLIGNPFCFDNANRSDMPEAVQANRKKTRRNTTIFVVTCAVIGLIVGAFAGRQAASVQPETWKSAGISITLTNQFSADNAEGYTACFGSQDVAVYALKEPFSLMAGAEALTVEQYCEMVVDNNDFNMTQEPKTQDGLTWFEFSWTNPETNLTYCYFAATYKTDDAFWLVQFATNQTKWEQYHSQFIQWAKSVSFY